jgi:hypothetical protein
LLAGAMLGVLAVVVFVSYFPVGNRLSSRVTDAALQRVRPGMPVEDLYRDLGPPLQVRTKSPADATRFFLDYSEPGWLNEGYAITIETSPVEVVNVVVEYADLVVYKCDSSQCPQFVWRRDLFDAIGHR